MRKIFAYLMENGYRPALEDSCMLLQANDNSFVLEHHDNTLTLRTFYAIEKDEYDLFLEASNMSMLDSFMIKPVIMDEGESLMFSCETFCVTFSDFRRFFPMMMEYMGKGIDAHKHYMNELLGMTELLGGKMPVSNEQVIRTGTMGSKLLS